MISKFLVALDGSDHASKALDLAIELAKSSKASITVLNVASDRPLTESEVQLARTEYKNQVGQALNLPDFTREPPVANADALAMASQGVGLAVRQAIAQRLVEMAVAEAKRKGVSQVDTRIEVGDPATAILAAASDTKPDFIVMGTRGLGGMQGLLMGSVSHKVVHLAKCSVITVK